MRTARGLAAMTPFPLFLPSLALATEGSFLCRNFRGNNFAASF